MKKKYAISFLGIVFLAQLLELASDTIANSIIYHYFMYGCYLVMAFLLLTMKKDKSEHLSTMGKIKKSLSDHPLRNLIIDTKDTYNDISKKHLFGDVSKDKKKLEEKNNQLKY